MLLLVEAGNLLIARGQLHAEIDVSVPLVGH